MISPLQQALQFFPRSQTCRIFLDRNIWPPLIVINSFFTCGYDDSAISEHASIAWDPFHITNADYESLLNHFDANPAMIETFDEATNYQDWFSRYPFP